MPFPHFDEKTTHADKFRYIYLIDLHRLVDRSVHIW